MDDVAKGGQVLGGGGRRSRSWWREEEEALEAGGISRYGRPTRFRRMNRNERTNLGTGVPFTSG